MEPSSGPATTAVGNHFSCSMAAVLLARVNAFGGTTAEGRLLREADSYRAPAYLTDIANWISFDDAIALWRGPARG